MYAAGLTEVQDGYTVTERGARGGYLLAIGRRYTTRELASELGYSDNAAAWKLLTQTSRVVPLRRCDDDGKCELAPPAECGSIAK